MTKTSQANQSADPYFRLLCEADTKLAIQVLESILNGAYRSEFRLENVVVNDDWTPWQILEKIAKKWEADKSSKSAYLPSILRHPNCDLKYLDKAVNSGDEDLMTGATQSPHINPKQIEILKQSKLPRVISGLMLNDGFTSEELIKLIQEDPKHSLVARHSKVLSHDLITELLKHVDLSNFGERVGDTLLNHPSVPDEVKAQLALLGFKKKDEQTQNLGGKVSKISQWAFLIGEPKAALDFFVEHGHPAGLFYAGATSKQPIECSAEAVEDLVEFEFIHRAFWPEVSQLDDAYLEYNRSSYDGDSFALRHKKIDFEREGDFSQPRGTDFVAFVRGYPFVPRDWIEALTTFESLTDEMSGRGLERLFDDILPESDGDFTLEEIALYVLAEGWLQNEFTFTEDGKSDLVDAWENFFDDDVLLHVEVVWEEVPPFQWSLLNPEKQRAAIEYLLNAHELPNEGTQLVAEHFLACAALHPKTDAAAFNLLKDCKLDWVVQAMGIRNKG